MTLKLSICISTLNRASFIGATLESIIAQVTSDCEIVILDGGSTDTTKSVVARYAKMFEGLRYIRQDVNGGVDRDFDRAIELARGEYCWLFSDDDLLKQGAISRVLKALQADHSLVLMNGEHRDFTMSSVCIPSFFGISSDRTYTSEEMDRLFDELGTCLICICCVIVKRRIWLERERVRYFGSRFIHIGVIFQRPLPGSTFVISTPLMSLRLDNEQTHAKEGFFVWHISLPSLIWSLPLSMTTKERFCRSEPWKDVEYLLLLRAAGDYSWSVYRKFICSRLRSCREALPPPLVACIPRWLAYRLFRLHSLVTGRRGVSRAPWRTMFPESWNRYIDGLSRRHGAHESKNA